jgi:hypothetical protein
MYSGFSFSINLTENHPVFPNRIIYSSHEGAQLGVVGIEMIGPAIIGTVLFIPSSVNLFFTDFAKSFFY